MDSAAALGQVEEKIARACKIARRDVSEVNLIAVSKTHPAERIEPVLEAGHRLYGENRVQEAQEKWPPLRERYADVELHLIGQLQSNKAEDAAALFDVIHSLDRPSLLKALAKAYDKLDRLLREHRFDTMSAALGQRGDSWRTKLPALRASELFG